MQCLIALAAEQLECIYFASKSTLFPRVVRKASSMPSYQLRYGATETLLPGLQEGKGAGMHD